MMQSAAALQSEPRVLVIAGLEKLRCPQTGLRLAAVPYEEALTLMRADRLVARAETNGAQPAGVTPIVLVRQDLACAYPVVDGMPVLLAPEMLFAPSAARQFDLRDPRYAEAYEEMQFYNDVGARAAASIQDSEHARIIAPILSASAAERASFPEPSRVWLDATYDAAAQRDIYRHLAPIAGGTFMQLGGGGIHAVKFLLAGAAEAWLCTPMLGEAKAALQLAEYAGVADRFRVAIGIAEELPFADEMFDGVYCGGCVHHMLTDLAMPGIRRVLKEGGRFGASEPWRTPFYAVGTRIFGKREVEVHCRPLNDERVRSLYVNFPNARVVHHGSFTRYPLLVAQKLGAGCGLTTAMRVNAVDDAISSIIPGTRKLGSSVALLAEKQHTNSPSKRKHG
jgi:SAM-dependent methyltransferase/uncharacterized protein YbaR (Trm112 family)